MAMMLPRLLDATAKNTDQRKRKSSSIKTINFQAAARRSALIGPWCLHSTFVLGAMMILVSSQLLRTCQATIFTHNTAGELATAYSSIPALDSSGNLPSSSSWIEGHLYEATLVYLKDNPCLCNPAAGDKANSNESREQENASIMDWPMLSERDPTLLSPQETITLPTSTTPTAIALLVSSGGDCSLSYKIRAAESIQKRQGLNVEYLIFFHNNCNSNNNDCDYDRMGETFWTPIVLDGDDDDAIATTKFKILSVSYQTGLILRDYTFAASSTIAAQEEKETGVVAFATTSSSFSNNNSNTWGPPRISINCDPPLVENGSQQGTSTDTSNTLSLPSSFAFCFLTIVVPCGLFMIISIIVQQCRLNPEEEGYASFQASSSPLWTIVMGIIDTSEDEENNGGPSTRNASIHRLTKQDIHRYLQNRQSTEKNGTITTNKITTATALAAAATAAAATATTPTTPTTSTSSSYKLLTEKHQSPKFEKNDIAAVPAVVNNNNKETPCCAICIDDLNGPSSSSSHYNSYQAMPQLELPCSHVFHADCIIPWLTERQGNCPLCKFNVALFVQQQQLQSSSSSCSLATSSDISCDSTAEGDAASVAASVAASNAASAAAAATATATQVEQQRPTSTIQLDSFFALVQQRFNNMLAATTRSRRGRRGSQVDFNESEDSRELELREDLA